MSNPNWLEAEAYRVLPHSGPHVPLARAYRAGEWDGSQVQLAEIACGIRRIAGVGRAIENWIAESLFRKAGVLPNA